jgi:UDP-GlcNAc3NAcA epimerase
VSLCTIAAARPQFIKATNVSRIMHGELQVKEVLIHTNQRYDEGLSNILFDQPAIPAPHDSLSIGSAIHGAQTGRMPEAIERVLPEQRPDRVLVHGDTNSKPLGKARRPRRLLGC